jgi:phage shock protein C
MKLSKDIQNKMISGVCSGLSKYSGIDVTLLRIGFVFGALFTGSILFWFYILMAILLPKE